MSYFFEIVCLANSYKHQGRCVAGPIYNLGHVDWIRPVGNREGRGIYPHELILDNTKNLKKLDIIRIEFSHQHVGTFQSENHYISQNRWSYLGSMNHADLINYCSDPQILWKNYSSSRYGHYDELLISDFTNPITRNQNPTQTIQLINILTPCQIIVQEEWDKKSVRIDFTFNDIEYSLKISDPEWKDYYIRQPIGTYERNDIRFLTISLTEPLDNGKIYKVVAGIF